MYSLRRAATALPHSGPTQYTQWLSQRLVTNAGPSARAGFKNGLWNIIKNICYNLVVIYSSMFFLICIIVIHVRFIFFKLCTGRKWYRMRKLTNVHFLRSCFLVRSTVKRIFLFGVYCTRVSKQVEPRDWILFFSFLPFFLSPPYPTFPSLLNCRCCLKTRTWGWFERNREPLWIDRLRKRMRTTEGKTRKKGLLS